MRVQELLEFNSMPDPDATSQGLYDPRFDELNTRHKNQQRKQKLTLQKLNRLKKIRAVKKLEMIKRQKLYSVIYGKPKEEEGGGGGGSPF
jgi:hypothetical protein